MRDTVIGIVYVVFVFVVVVVCAVIISVSVAAKVECQALGFEHGYYQFWPEQQVMCEYRLRVPLREVLPPLEQGASDNGRLRRL
jgi:hypothetical protein